ncbi:MAG: hypothetical protein C4B55_01415 [Candidatus Methanophagaceae archaeon]|nr:MAG: hypothetical protein C4B55_01415 [Methanophagales archaeon]
MIIFALAVAVEVAAAIPPSPKYEVYRGDVFVNGTLAPDGTRVSVKVGALDEVEDSTENGTYWIAIKSSQASQGDMVTLKIYDAVVETAKIDKNDYISQNYINLYLEDYLVNESAQPDALPETTTESRILVNWAFYSGYDSTGVKCYELLRRYEDEKTFSSLVKTNNTRYFDILNATGEYCYRLVTYDFVGNSKNSTQDVCTTFVSNKTFTLNGFVKYENGTGVSNANVTLEKYFNPVNSTTTTEKGYYELAASWKRYNLTAAKGDVLVWGREGKGGAKYISFLNSSAVVNLDANKTVNLTLVVKGDLDGDCAVGIADVRVVARMLVGSVSEDLKADFNGNGCVDLGDAAKLLGFVKGGVSKL